MNQRTGFYVARPSSIHRLNPATKLAGAALILAAGFCIPGLVTAPLLFVLVLIPLSLLAGVVGSFLKTVLTILFPVFISLVLVQGFFYPTPNPTLIPIGPVALRLEGLLFGLQTGGRLLLVAGIPLLVFQTTHPVQLIQSLTERGLPRSGGYVVLVALQLIPAVQERSAAVADAQRARGLETEGSVLRRARGLLPLVGPLIIGMLLEVEERALALESRAFLAPGPKTTLMDLPDTSGERVARYVMVALAAGLVIWRIVVVVLGS
jgi:energy-coupling factor transport system permease protein